MNQRYDVLGFGLAFIAIALIAISAPLFDHVVPRGWAFEWQSLCGSIIGACGTIFAGWLALRGINKTLARDAVQQRVRQETAKIASIMALTQPVHAATGVMIALRRGLGVTAPDAVKHADAVIERSVAQLDVALDHFSLRDVAGDMNADDRIQFLMVVLRFSSFVNMAMRPLPAADRRGTILLRITMLEDNEHFIRIFDADLGNVYARDGQIQRVDE